MNCHVKTISLLVSLCHLRTTRPVHHIFSISQPKQGTKAIHHELTWTADGTGLIHFDLDAMTFQSYGGRYRLDFSAISSETPVPAASVMMVQFPEPTLT